MKPTDSFKTWDGTPAHAREIQEQIRHAVIAEDDFGTLERIAGVDIGFEQGGDVTRAAVAVLDFTTLEIIETAVARRPTTFPYVPGLLSFREIPAALDALNQLSRPPDMMVYDGQGVAHPRRLGIAAHLGLITNLPSIGVAKKRLVGEFEEPAQARGAQSPLFHHDEQIGLVLRTRVNVKPVFVSVGHRVSLTSAREIVMQLVTRYKLPETTRAAHRLASR